MSKFRPRKKKIYDSFTDFFAAYLLKQIKQKIDEIKDEKPNQSHKTTRKLKFSTNQKKKSGPFIKDPSSAKNLHWITWSFYNLNEVEEFIIYRLFYEGINTANLILDSTAYLFSIEFSETPEKPNKKKDQYLTFSQSSAK